MRQIRVVRIFFLSCVGLAVAAFWTGFYFGNTRSGTIEMIAKNTAEINEQSMADDTSGMDDSAEANNTTAAETVESMTEISPETYYLKSNGSYLSVYQGSSSEVYFETGIRLRDLPENMQNAAREGIAFDNLEELYGFLENYSS